MDKVSILDGKVHVYKRDNSRFWQCSTYMQKNHRTSTKCEVLREAKEFAEDWYFDLRSLHKRGEILGEKTFADAAKKFELEYEVITEGQRSPKWVRGHKDRIRLHLNPFFGKLAISKVTSGKVQDYRVKRMQSEKPPAPSTLHDEIGTLRLVLKTALRHDWLDRLPDMSAPYQMNMKVRRRAWFSPQEYRTLYEATRENARHPKRARDKIHAENLHDYVLFMCNTGLRPDEANNLKYRDVDIVQDEATEDTILEIEVRGKRGVGYCKSTKGAVRPFQRLLERNKPRQGDKVFPNDHKKMFNRILNDLELKEDRDGQRRTSYSFRHTYICFRLMEGADVYQLAKNCRTSVEMIEKHYAAHIKHLLDTTAINKRKAN